MDTGFSGWLTLTQPIVDELNLTHYGQRLSILADGTQSFMVRWSGGKDSPVLYSFTSQKADDL